MRHGSDLVDGDKRIAASCDVNFASAIYDKTCLVVERIHMTKLEIKRVRVICGPVWDKEAKPVGIKARFMEQINCPRFVLDNRVTRCAKRDGTRIKDPNNGVVDEVG